ncbi:MAG: hypothetical protein ACKVQA_14910 [Burkholderiales bacterium]
MKPSDLGNGEFVRTQRSRHAPAALAALLMLAGCALEPREGGGQCAAPGAPLAATLVETIRSGPLQSAPGSAPGGLFSLISPEQIAISSADLFIADRGRAALVRLQRAQGSFSVMASMTSRVSGMHVDRFGTLYLALPGEGRVAQLSPDGGPERNFAGAGALSSPVDVTSDGVSRIFAADATGARVVVFNRLGQVMGTLGETTAMPNPFRSVTALAHGEQGLYVLDAAARQVHLIATRGAGRIWDMGQFARLPVALAADRFGRVFVADRGSSRIVVLDALGSGEPLALENVPPLQDLSDVWIDDFGVLYAADAAAGVVYSLHIPGPCP